MICFTICLCVSPDFDGYKAPKMKHLAPHDGMMNLDVMLLINVSSA